MCSIPSYDFMFLGKDDIIKMEDSICTEKPSHKKPLAGHPKARKSGKLTFPSVLDSCYASELLL